MDKVRVRQVEVALASRTLPLLGVSERDLLRSWAKSDAPTRRWPALLAMAGVTGIEAAERLAESLCERGWLAFKESFVKGSWRVESIVWTDLGALKTLLGLDTRTERQSRRARQLRELADWVVEHPDLQAAVESLVDAAALTAERLGERFALLRAVAAWRSEGRNGTRRDFALEARDGTKSLTETEWRWLDEHVDLPAFGIEGFTPLIWLAGATTLSWPGRVVDVHGLQFVGLVAADLARVERAAVPERYWLIENRASFERQATRLEPGVLLVWLPGRPSIAWCDAMRALLAVAPAPARISADPDPAGVEIAMTAASLWAARGLAWEAWRMGVEELSASRRQRPLDAEHDPRVLSRLAERVDLPDALVALCDHMRRHSVKAEQEGWL